MKRYLHIQRDKMHSRSLCIYTALTFSAYCRHRLLGRTSTFRLSMLLCVFVLWDAVARLFGGEKGERAGW